MNFDNDSDYGFAEKILDKVIAMRYEGELPVLPTSKNVKSQICYDKACKMLWSIYDGTFFKQYSFVERGDYNMHGWKDKIKACEDDWSAIHSLVIGSVKNFRESKKPEYVPLNKDFLNSITFSRFFLSGLNQSMFVNCINPPLLNKMFVCKASLEHIRNNVPEKYKPYAEKFFDKHFAESPYQLTYWKGIRDIIEWWEWFKKYTKFSFDVQGNLSKENVIFDYCEYLSCFMYEYKREPSTYWFVIHNKDNDSLDGMFARYVMTDKFTVAKELPRPLRWYGSEERFKGLVVDKKSDNIIKLTDENSFIDNLEVNS